ncbi:hypothetical protein GCM10010276_67600 [Streptomyces longisporus]|uniref:Uncharacterized protein n=2 Tax=Streptomyces longisporus TaxID=1948 RepID=A0ABN3MYE4_STRLO
MRFGVYMPALVLQVLQMLLTTAVRSPAYGSGMAGAYGRLAAWHRLIPAASRLHVKTPPSA